MYVYLANFLIIIFILLNVDKNAKDGVTEHVIMHATDFSGYQSLFSHLQCIIIDHRYEYLKPAVFIAVCCTRELRTTRPVCSAVLSASDFRPSADAYCVTKLHFNINILTFYRKHTALNFIRVISDTQVSIN